VPGKPTIFSKRKPKGLGVCVADELEVSPSGGGLHTYTFTHTQTHTNTDIHTYIYIYRYLYLSIYLSMYYLSNVYIYLSNDILIYSGRRI
jgi:hypothetical protein